MLGNRSFARALLVMVAGLMPATVAAQADGDQEQGEAPAGAMGKRAGGGSSASPIAAPILDADDDEPGAPAPAAATTGKATGKISAASGGRKQRLRGRTKRRGLVTGRVVAESELRAEPPAPPSGKLHLYNLALHDEVEVNIFNDDGSYSIEALRKVDHLMRCKRTSAEKQMEPRLLVALSHLYDHFGKRIDVVSAYRNQRKQTSYHYKGTASDIRIQGVSPSKVRAFAETLDAGGMGVGIYPRSQFVHIDIRPTSYRWVDYSRSNPNSPDKRPPRNWKKRKKLQS